MISADIFEDDFFISLTMFERMVWIGIVTRCADDQGRLQDRSVLIKSQVFPADLVSIDDIETALEKFAATGKIIRYTAGEKAMIQIVNWWKHQTPQWASKSRYPAPPGWIDREKYHASGNKIITSNWDKKGGFIEVTNQDTNLVTNQDTNLITSSIKERREEDVNGDGEAEDERTPTATKTATATAGNVQNAPKLGQRPNIFAVYERDIGLLTPGIADDLLEIEREYPPGWFELAVSEALRNNARKLSYIRAILRRWKTDGLNPLERKPATPVPRAANPTQPTVQSQYTLEQVNAMRANAGKPPITLEEYKCL